MNNIQCPNCNQMSMELEFLRAQNKMLLDQLTKNESVRTDPRIIVTTKEEVERIRGGLVNPDGGHYPLKWMSQPVKEPNRDE